jgi:hypothetical protein
MRGRPSDYNTEIADKICDLLAEGMSLREICRQDGFPSVGAVCRWLGKNEEFHKQYARAREAQADAIADEILDIADNAKNDWMIRDGKPVENHESIRRAQLRIDSRKWLAGKMRPKKYSDKIISEVSGPDGNPIAMENVSLKGLTDKELENMQKMLEKAKG